MSYKLLDNINSPTELKQLPEGDMKALCSELRDFLIDNVPKTGGHLASNLGAVELTVALHRYFDSPTDKIIFDVGHQAYIHKILTGRKHLFDRLRTTGGLSGFTVRKESEHDPFGAGHSSTSISAALGFAEANKLSGSDAYTVAVLGDGAFTGGMVHEAINNCKQDLKLIIVLNENRMSISQNKGTFASYLARVRRSERYLKWKQGTNTVLRKIPLLGKPTILFLSAVKNKFKKMIYSTNYFEDLGFYYIGPVDGNNYSSLSRAIKEAKKLNKCCIIHTYTKKGKGYEPAERSPDDFHSLRINKKSSTFHSEVAKKLIEMAEDDERIVSVTAAMGIGTGMSQFGERFPDRYFDVGIAEAHAITFSAGLAAAGYKPYAAIYSTFLQRAYDSIIHDVALQDLPVRMLIDRAGLAVADGATHHGIFDIAFLMHIPSVGLYSPASYASLKRFMEDTKDTPSAVAIRYPDSEEVSSAAEFSYKDNCITSGVSRDFLGSVDYVFIAVGCAVGYCIEAKRKLSEIGIDSGIVLIEKLKPYSDAIPFVLECIKGAKKVLFVEEGIKNGGFSMIFKDALENASMVTRNIEIDVCALDDNFASPDFKVDLYDYAGLSPDKLAARIKERKI